MEGARFDEIEQKKLVWLLLDNAEQIVDTSRRELDEARDDLMGIVHALGKDVLALTPKSVGANILNFPDLPERDKAIKEAMARHPSSQGKSISKLFELEAKESAEVIPLFSRPEDNPTIAPHWSEAPKDGEHVVAIPFRDIETYRSLKDKLPPDQQQ